MVIQRLDSLFSSSDLLKTFAWFLRIRLQLGIQMKSNPPLISEWDYLSGMSISSTRLHFMTLFYRNLSLGKDLPRRIDLLRVKMYIFSPLLCQVYFSLLLKLIFCKCNLVQWFAFERCWISFLDVVHVSLAIFANNLQLSAF